MSRAPNHEFQEWWNKQRERGLDPSSPDGGGGGPVLPVEIRTPRSDQAVEKSRARSARQLSWVCLLRFQQIASLVASAAGSLVSILRTANRRIAASPADSSSSRLYRIIRFFLILVLVLLGFELLAFSKGWHFSPPSVGSKEVLGFVELVYANWLEIRAKYLAPPLQSLTNVCIVLFLIQSVDRVVLVLGCLWIKIKGIKPVASVDYEKKGDLDSESGGEVFPMVLVQIPMCNEREVRTCRFLSSLLRRHSRFTHCC